MCSMVRIDGKTYRIMGAKPADVPAMEQTGLHGAADAHDLSASRPPACECALTFTTPMLPRRSRSGRPAGHVSDVERLRH